MSEIKKEIEFIMQHKNIKALKIFDSTFTANREHVISFCNMISQYNFLWECEIRADTVDKGLLSQMKGAGCCSINVGLETTNERLLKQIGKNITVKQVESVLAWCKDLDIKTKVFFTFGHPEQTYEDCIEDITYIRKKREDIDFYATTIGMRVYPGTRLETQLQKNNLMPKDFSWAKYKPPLKNLLLLEPDDTFILEQKKLSFLLLFTLIIKLCMQGTVLSGNYIRKTLWNNVAGIFAGTIVQARYTRHRIKRMVNKMYSGYLR